MGFPIYRQDQLNRDLGTDAPVRTLEQTQAPLAKYTGSSAIFDETGAVSNFRRNEETGELYDGTGLESVVPTGLGIGALSEDLGKLTRGVVSTSINSSNALNSGIKPQPNILDDFASYTYSLSWYMLTVEQSKALKIAQKINTTQWSLLMQSGGATTTQAGTATPSSLAATLTGATSSASPGRNKYFSLDYYLDNLVIETSFNNIAMSTVNKISFTVTEPNGITLLQNLAYAVQDMYKDSKVTAKDAVYVMAIKFFGYDANGNLITASSSGGSKAAVTKYFPFKIADFEFKAANRAVEYMVQGLPLNDIIGKSSALGSIPQNYELVGVTVDDLLNGKATSSNSAATESSDRGSQNKATPNQGAPSPASVVNDIRASAGIDSNGSFTGETASPFTVIAA